MPTVIEQQDRTVSETFSYENVVEICEAASSVNEAALYIERMELTEPMKIAHAPNHLLETKTYAKVGQNDFVQVKPSIIHFEGFEVDKKQVKSLKLLNASSDILRIHIIPPQTQNFSIKYTKQARMVPGMSLECVIEFKPDEWRYYYDFVRIHCPGEDNLIIPIHAYPVMDTKEFPRNYVFKPIPLGNRICKKFPLKSMSPIDFEFNFNYIRTHPSFSLEPLSGIVPANGQAEIAVSFTPYEFETASMVVELTISQFNLKGILSTFSGSSKPGLLKEKTLLILDPEILDPKFVSPLDRARTKKQKVQAIIYKQQRKKSAPGTTQMSTLEKDGVRFPAVLNTPHAVNNVLMQEPGKLRASDLKQNLLAGNNLSEESSQQMKEAKFEQAVRQNVYEERQNQLRWQVRVGDDPLSVTERCMILENRSTVLDNYKNKRLDEPVAEEETGRQETVCTYRRTIRNVDQLPTEVALFDVYANDLWTVRHAVLERFVQAARTIIIRNRCEKRLRCLRDLVVNFNLKKTLGISEDDSRARTESLIKRLSFTADKIKKYSFPVYVDPNFKDDMAPDALGIVSSTPTQIAVKRDVPFFNLKVPQYYKLQGYQKHSTFLGYMPAKQNNDLRTGAEDEIIKIPDEASFVCPVPDSAVGPQKMVEKREKTIIPVQPLAPPGALLKPVEYPRLQIMNPAPGLQMFLPALPYSVIDVDYHLCPVPKYSQSNQAVNKYPVAQKRFVDREDTIKGIMGWKKFPSQGIISMANSSTLTSVWVPRWNDAFSRDLLPEDVPPLLSSLDPDDESCVENNEDSNAVCLNPAMVSAQFPPIDPNAQVHRKSTGNDETGSLSEWEAFPSGNKLPRTNIPSGANGPIMKEQREEELENFTAKKNNRLGTKFSEKIVELNAKITDQDLILK